MALALNSNSIMQSDPVAIDSHVMRLPYRALYLKSRLLEGIFYVGPHFSVDFNFRQLRQTLSSQLPIAPLSRATLHIPLLEVTDLETCMFYLIHHFTRTNATDGLAFPEIYRLAFKMASYITGIALTRNFLGLHVKVDVTLVVSDTPLPIVIPRAVNRASPREDTVILEETVAGESVKQTGASDSALDRLKAERFCFNSDIGTEPETCAVCLEELSGGAFLTRMPCSHIFHESCIFEWLKKADTCPLCRHELED